MKKTNKDLSEMLEAARGRQGSASFCGYIHAYCDNRRCVGREFSIKIKPDWDDRLKFVICPLCGEEPILNGVQTFEEHECKADQNARMRVNIQRYVQRAGGGPVPIPASVFLDDSLDGKPVDDAA